MRARRIRARMKYFIIWCDSQEPHLRWMKKGFRHVWIIAHGDDNETIVLDLLSLSYEIKFMGHYRLDQLFDYWFEQGYRALRVEPGRCRIWLPGPLTCVTVIKRFLGIFSPFVITPYQLWKFLDKKGNYNKT